MKKSNLIQIIKEEISSVLSKQPLSRKNSFPKIAKITANSLEQGKGMAVGDEEFEKEENQALLQAIENDLASLEPSLAARGRAALSKFTYRQSTRDTAASIYDRYYGKNS